MSDPSQNTPAPRRDKFAALASRAAETPVTIPVVNPETATADPPAPTIAASPAPRRDKLSALTSRNAAAAIDVDAEAPNYIPESVSAPVTVASAPRPDKLSALVSRQQASDVAPSGGRGNKFAGAARGNKLAALTAANNSTSTVDNTAVASNASLVQEERMKNIQERLTQRQEILNNLDRAEEMTVKLLELAHKTTTALQDLSTSPAITELSKAYRDTLQKLHPLLSTDTQSLIHPYQNHSFESTNSMYAARVEMRLAQERSQVLKTFGELERSKRVKREDDVNENNKRPREDETAPIS